MLLNAAERDDAVLALSLQPRACLACGLCSYVCPAELPLSQAAIRWKGLATQDV
jgi:Na+-translocating ferredoxin:NAD+ oxidoreductase RnfC subunit